ncbi:hypothetical protein Sfum_1807 [Syntrophobacter fumaroxidans MPOB]|uniref:Uncharacterized protein n=1 Tax=Syntrophobacter fumaroxidans (strain DSM 10017 / MPOB) TaxID=335543 RepID=A0LJ90_SYNFM|nr:hypothetical protein Sfum_1807 [Syntrophobacter fumaroxidans MPOB]
MQGYSRTGVIPLFHSNARRRAFARKRMLTGVSKILPLKNLLFLDFSGVCRVNHALLPFGFERALNAPGMRVHPEIGWLFKICPSYSGDLLLTCSRPV